MDGLHDVLRSIRSESKAQARDHLDVFREFLDHLDRAARRRGTETWGNAESVEPHYQDDGGCVPNTVSVRIPVLLTVPDLLWVAGEEAAMNDPIQFVIILGLVLFAGLCLRCAWRMFKSR